MITNEGQQLITGNEVEVLINTHHVQTSLLSRLDYKICDKCNLILLPKRNTSMIKPLIYACESYSWGRLCPVVINTSCIRDRTWQFWSIKWSLASITAGSNTRNWRKKTWHEAKFLNWFMPFLQRVSFREKE